MTAEFLPYFDGLPHDEYLQSHRLRYWETWLRLHDLTAGLRDVLELGSMSPVGGFLRDRQGASVATVETDLRGRGPGLILPSDPAGLLTRKKAAVASGPKFREETPKKGSRPATPIAVLQCTA